MLVYQRVNPMNQYLTPKSCPNLPKYNWIGKWYTISQAPCLGLFDRMMAQTEMKTETSINSFAEEGGDDVFHSWNFGIHMGISGDLNTFHGVWIHLFISRSWICWRWWCSDVLNFAKINVEFMGRCVIFAGVLKQIQVLWLWQVSFFLLPCWCNNRDIMFLCRLVISSKQ